MTLIKSLLLGSAAGIVAVASAQAADLPTKKGAPAAQYVQVCTINGITGFTIPGSDTCLKIYGLIHFKVDLGTTSSPARSIALSDHPGAYTVASNATSAQSSLGWYTRALIGFTAVSNTAYGPLTADFAYDVQGGEGFDNGTGPAGVDHALITWAGLYAGYGNGSKYEGYMSGSLATDDDMVSVDHSPFEVGYTASFGGGFSATLGIESQANHLGPNVVGVGERAPDVVAALDVAQAWGKAHIGVVAHNVNTVSAVGLGGINTWGYGVLGALEVNIPGMKGSKFDIQGDFAHDAVGDAGLAGSYGFYNLSATPIFADVAVNNAGTGYVGSDAWSVNAGLSLQVAPTVSIGPEVSYGAVTYGSGSSVSNSSVFIGGGNIEFVPVTNLKFDLDLIYQSAQISALGTAPSVNANGFGAKFRIQRAF